MGYPGARRTIAPRTQHGLPDIATMRLRLLDSVIPGGHILTAAIDFASLNDVAISRIESKLLEPFSVNVNKGATGRQRTRRPVAKARFRRGGR